MNRSATISATWKIRASWGSFGSQPSDYYPYQAVMGSGQPGFIIDGQYVSSVNTPGLVSPSLTWEKAASTNIGLDISALRSRLNVMFDIYERKTTDILTTGSVAYPSVLGASAPLENSGSLRARGWELDIQWNDRIGRVNYGVSFNLSDAVTTVLNYLQPHQVVWLAATTARLSVKSGATHLAASFRPKTSSSWATNISSMAPTPAVTLFIPARHGTRMSTATASSAPVPALSTTRATITSSATAPPLPLRPLAQRFLERI